MKWWRWDRVLQIFKTWSHLDLPFNGVVRIGPFLDDSVFSFQGLFLSFSPFPPPYTSRYSALRPLLHPTKGNGRREFGLWRGPGSIAVISSGGCGRWFGTDGLRRGSVGRRKKNAKNIIVEVGRCRGHEFIEKLDFVSLFTEHLAHTGPVPSHWQLDGTSGVLGFTEDFLPRGNATQNGNGELN